MAVGLAQRAVFFDSFIVQTRASIRLAWILALAVFASGVICAILINVFSESAGLEGNSKLIGTIGSCLVSLLSAAPLKDYFGQRARINAFQYITGRYERLSERH